MIIEKFEPSFFNEINDCFFLGFGVGCFSIKNDKGSEICNDYSFLIKVESNYFQLENGWLKVSLSDEFGSNLRITIDEIAKVTDLEERIMNFIEFGTRFEKELSETNIETRQLIKQLEKMNIEHAINLALDMNDKDMFLKLANGVY